MSLEKELAEIDRLLSGAPPERIFDWMQTPLSIARHYGGIKYQGSHYVIDRENARLPLVREDVLAREVAQRAEAEKARERAAADAQSNLF